MTSSTFDKMLARERNSLPDNTGNYYELEHGNLKYDGVKNTNDAIDASVQDFKDKTERAIRESERYHNSKKAQLGKLVGLIGIAGDFQNWKKARDVANAQFDTTYKTYKDFEGEVPVNTDTGQPIKTESQEKYEEEAKVVSKEIEKQSVNTIRFADAATTELAPDQLIAIHSRTEKTQDYMSGIEAGIEYQEGFQPYFDGALHIKKQLVHPDTGEVMPVAMSLMEVIESDNREIKKYLPWLYRDIFADYHAANANLVETMGDRYYKEKIFPNIYKTGGELRGRLLSRQLELSIKRAKDNLNRDTLARYRSEGNEYLFGEEGFLSIREQTLDGKKDNALAWRELTEWVTWAIDNDEIGIKEGEDILDAKVKKRGTDKLVSLEDLNNPNVDTFIRKVGISLAEAKRQRRILDDANDYSIVKGLADVSLERLQTGGPVATPSTINAEIVKTIQSAREQGIYINSSHPALSDLKNYGNTVEKRQEWSRNVLDEQIEDEVPLSDELIKYLPRNEQQKYRDFGETFGIAGLTPLEKKEARNNIEYLMRVEPATAIGRDLNSEDGTIMFNRAVKMFEDEYENNRIVEVQKGNTKNAKENAKRLALDLVKKELKKMKADPNYTGYIGGSIEINKITSGETRQADEIIQSLKQNKDKAISTPRYWPGEEEAIKEFIEWNKNGQKGPPPSYYRAYNTSAGMTARDLATARLEATKDLREEEVELDENNFNSDNYDTGATKEGGDISKTVNAGLTGALPVMLDDLIMEGRDFDTVYSPAGTTSKGYQEEKFDNEVRNDKPLSQSTIGEVLLTFRDAEDKNIKLTFGAYDIPGDVLWDMHNQGLLNTDAPFDEEAQKEIVWRRILTKAQTISANKTWSNTYRRYNWLTKEEKGRFTKIITEITGKEEFETDPYSSLELLTPSVAKALTALGMGQEIPTE